MARRELVILMSAILLLGLCMLLAAFECCPGPGLLRPPCATWLCPLTLLGGMAMPLGWGYLCTNWCQPARSSLPVLFWRPD